MSSPTSSGGGEEGSPPSLSGFRYGVGLSFTVLTIIVTITLLSYFCTRRTRTDHQSTATSGPGPPASLVMITVTGGGEVDRQRGLNDAALRSFPKLLYSQAKLHRQQESKNSYNNNNNNNSLSCSICLSDYVDTDMLRLLPDCGHLFHLGCVDSWLRQCATCPICRSSPIPTPLATPLAEVAPLAGPRG